MAILGKINKLLNQALIVLSGIILVGMMALACLNILARSFWMPINGTFETMGFLGALVAALPLGSTLMQRAHISVDVLVNRYPRRVRLLANGLNHLVCMLFFAVTAWQISAWATTIRQTGEVTETLRVVYYPYIYGVACACAVLALACLTECLHNLFAGRRGAA